jgi:two-component system, OmpR family, phosphate regulon sensor histidine kinase PhoR
LTSEITSSLKLRELQVEEANRMLLQLDREKTQATLRATHELKAPFAAIQGYVYSLRDGYYGTLPERAELVIQRIGERCDRLMTMITDIIHLSVIRSRSFSEVEFAPVNLTAHLAKEVQEAAVLAEPRGIKIENLSENAPEYLILAASRELQTLISNLLRNAINYSHEKGWVVVTLKAAPSQVTLCVQDYGIGIPQDVLPKIFDDHFRANNAAAHNAQGNGLGLALVKEIVKVHGASIDVTSEEGKGTCFSVCFKIYQPEQEGRTNGQGSNHRR